MSFTIPNAADAAFADQAEPDSGDLRIVTDASAGTGVVSGCAVTAQGTPDMTVAVAEGVVAVAGVDVAVEAGDVAVTAADGSNARFDLVTVDASGAKAVVAGTPSANPVFPSIPAGAVVLAAVYVPAGDSAVGATQIVDKRVNLALAGGWPQPSGGDDSARIQGWIDAAYIVGGEVLLGPGYWVGQDLVHRGYVRIRGRGSGLTYLSLPDGADTDLIVTEDFDSLTGGTVQGGPSDFGISGLTLDGNRANNSSGWPLKIYGYAYVMDDVEVQQGASGGVWSEWGTGGTDMEALWSNFRIHECDGVGLDWRGPHDSAFVNGFVSKNTGDGIKTSGNATGEKFTNVHSWGTEQNWAWYLDKKAFLANCQGEGGSLGQLMIGASGTQVVGGSYFGTGVGAQVGIQLGDASHSSLTAVSVIGSFLDRFSSTGLPINIFSSGGGNRILVTMSSGPTTAISGTPANTDDIRIASSTPELAAGSLMRQFGRFLLTAASSTPGNTAFTIKDSAGADRFNFNANAPRLEVNSGGGIRFYSGSYSGQTWDIDGDGWLEGAEVATPSAPASNKGRLFFLDNGAGKTQLAVRFATGAVQVIATEP